MISAIQFLLFLLVGIPASLLPMKRAEPDGGPIIIRYKLARGCLIRPSIIRVASPRVSCSEQQAVVGVSASLSLVHRMEELFEKSAQLADDVRTGKKLVTPENMHYINGFMYPYFKYFCGDSTGALTALSRSDLEKVESSLRCHFTEESSCITFAEVEACRALLQHKDKDVLDDREKVFLAKLEQGLHRWRISLGKLATRCLQQVDVIQNHCQNGSVNDYNFFDQKEVTIPLPLWQKMRKEGPVMVVHPCGRPLYLKSDLASFCRGFYALPPFQEEQSLESHEVTGKRIAHRIAHY